MSPSTFHFLRIDIFCDRGSPPPPSPSWCWAEQLTEVLLYNLSSDRVSKGVYSCDFAWHLRQDLGSSPGISAGKNWDLRLASQDRIWNLRLASQAGFGAWPRNAASRLFSNSWAACPLVNHHHNSYHQLIFFLVGTVCLVSAKRNIWKNKETFIFFL